MAIGSLKGVTQAPPLREHQEKPVNAEEVGRPAPAATVSKESASAKASKEADASRLEKQMEAAKEQLSDYMERHSIEMRFSIDPDSKEVIVKVLHTETGELIRQIPSEEAIRISKAMDTEQGLIIQKRA